MSREIKFRIWDKDSGYFIKVSDTNKHYLSLNGDIIIIDEMGFIYETDKENYIIDKYTGLKDDKGKEIYEGDILLSSNINGIFLQLIGFGSSEKELNNMINGFKIINEKELISGFEFIDLNNKIKDIIIKNDIPYEYDGSDYFIYYSWYVVGNKWENPELMKLLEGKDDKKR